MTRRYPVDSFFYKLVFAKKPPRKASDSAFFIWYIKRQIGLAFLIFSSKYYDFLGYLTKYYPFSLFWQDRMFHYKKRRVRKFMIILDEFLETKGFNIVTLFGEEETYFAEFYSIFKKKTKDTKLEIRAMEEVLQKNFETIYARQDGNWIKILIPLAQFRKIFKN
jgi:hypothetical protein